LSDEDTPISHTLFVWKPIGSCKPFPQMDILELSALTGLHFQPAGRGDLKIMTNVSFIVPVRNEENHIRACLQTLVDQNYRLDDYEVVVVDGRSSDRTRSIVEEFAQQYPRVRLLDNPEGIVPTAMNIGIRAAQGEIIIRADGHNEYPPDYAANCVKYLAQTGADNVGGPWLTVAADESFSAKLVVAILSSPFGVGNSKFRTSREEGFVDTVPFGAFRREVFDRVGWYNEKLVRNQDNELNSRIRKTGGRIYLTPALTTYHHPVKNFLSLLKYAFKTSQWHIFTLRENKDSMGLRHLAPAVSLILLLLLLPVYFVSATSLSFLIGILCAYILLGFYFSLCAKTEGNWDVALIQPFATFCFHIAYGGGTLLGLRYLFRQPSIRPIRPGLPVRNERNEGVFRSQS
jgi:glycosyltransferase involved in cell wall biosynthesis